MEQDNRQINAVHEKDLDNLLAKFGVREKFKNNEATCKFCKNTVTTENIYSILPESGALHFICDKSECVGAFLQHLEEKKSKLIEDD